MKKNLMTKCFWTLAVCSLTWGCADDEPYKVPDDTNNEQTPGEEDKPGAGEEIEGEEILPTDDLVMFDINFDYSPLTETENIPTDETTEEYGDYIENSEFERTVTINFNENGAEVIKTNKDVKYTINDGAHVVINSTAKKVEYIVTGENSNGSLKIYSENKFQLQMNGVKLTNPNGAPINIQSKKRCFFVCNEGTLNTLTDGAVYTTTNPNEDEKGCIFSEGKIIFSGKGTLEVNGQGKHGISSDDYVRFRPGCNVKVSVSAGHGVKTNDAIYVSGGVVNVEVTGDGKKGFSTDGELLINGGRTTIITTGNAIYDPDANDISGCAAIKCDSTFVMNAGSLSLKSTGSGGKGLNVDQTITINGGEMNVITTGGNYAYGEGQTTTTRGIGSGMEMNINGGKICCYSMANDGIEADGILSINGGTIIASGAQAPCKGIHSKQALIINQGTVVSTGGGASTLSAESTQAALIYQASQVRVGTWFALANANGENLFGYQMPRSYQTLNLLVSMPAFNKGEACHLSSGGEVGGNNSWHELVIGGTYSSTEENAAEVTLQ